MSENVEKKGSAVQKSPAPKTREVAVLRVSGPERGRRRAGITFSGEMVELRLEDLTEDQVVAIETDPQLSAVTGMRQEVIEGETA